tara:strand:+ start:55 stop:1089 length:1035 start_codon:yes stop_codon:yes gene_type:complete
MAINVNTVYKTVLSILSKEQRGYLTPDEFNKISKEAQIMLLEVSFLEYNKMHSLDTMGNMHAGYADLPAKVKEKIDQFYKTSSVALSAGAGSLPTDVYKIIELTNSDRTLPFELVDKHELPYLLSSPLTKPSTDYPVYYKTATTSGATSVQVNPVSISTATLDYIKVPETPRWGYTTNATYGTHTYDSNTYVDGGIVLGAIDTGFITSGNSGLLDGTHTVTVGSTSNVTTSGSGTGLTITFTVSSNAITAMNVDAAGSGFSSGDTITISSLVSWASGVDIVLTLRATDIYNNTTRGSTNFELHPSEEPQLIMQILSFAGVTLKDPSVTAQAGQVIQANAMAKQQ